MKYLRFFVYFFGDIALTLLFMPLFILLGPLLLVLLSVQNGYHRGCCLALDKHSIIYCGHPYNYTNSRSSQPKNDG